MKRPPIVPLIALMGFWGCSSKGAHDGHAHNDEPKGQHKDEDGHDHEKEARSDHGDRGEEGHDDNLVELSEATLQRIKIQTQKAEERVLSNVLSTTGRVDFNQDRFAHVAPRIQGRVHKVGTTLGQEIKKGQTLAIIDSLQLGRAKSTMLTAKAQLTLTQKTLAREEKLLKDRVTSQQSVLEAQAAHQRALASYQSARQNLRLLGLSKRQINAVSYNDSAAALFPLSSPMNGTIVEKHINLGEIVSPDRNLFSIADLSQVWIWVDVYERDLGRVHLEDHVMVKVAAFSDRTFEGQVAYVQNQVDPKTRTVRARIDVKNADRALRPGMFAKVTVVDAHGVDGKESVRAIVIPANALQRQGDRRFVFVSTAPRRYERRFVVLGRKTAASVEILGGLKKGEAVVVNGAFYLKSEAAKAQMGGGHSH